MEKSEMAPTETSFVVRYVSSDICGLSPYRVLDARGFEVQPANDFLDMVATRGFSVRTTRTYAYCLLALWKWLSQSKSKLTDLTEVRLLEYIRFQNRAGERAARTINLRLKVARALYGFVTGRDFPVAHRSIVGRPFPWRSHSGRLLAHLRSSRPMEQRLRVKVPRRVVVPLSPKDVEMFLRSFRTWRDLGIVGLMLFSGLRSQEVLCVELEHFRPLEAEVLVRGKGSKERVVPLAGHVISSIQSYLEIERPRTKAGELFLVLKGPRRGKALTPSGLRSLFRHHRKRSTVTIANPHRFRHTFAADMVRGRISLPALMKLMGHSSIDHTLVYVNVSPEELRVEFQRAVALLNSQAKEEASRHASK
jgi:site-specific recombinase XerD